MLCTLPTRTDLGGPAVFKQHLVDLHIGQNSQVGALEYRPQKSLGSIPAHTGTLVDLKVSTALIVATVEIIDGGNPALRGGVTKCVQNRP